MEVVQPIEISVVIPAFNAEPYLSECVESVLQQTCLPNEIIIVDDGSTDRTLEIAQQLQTQHPHLINVLQHDRGINKGLSATRNLGIRQAKHEYICFNDADDIWEPEKLALQKEAFQKNPTIDLCFGRYMYIDEGGQPLSVTGFMYGGKGKAGKPHKYFDDLIVECNIPVITVMVRKQTLLSSGLFSETIFLYEDWLLWTKIGYNHLFFFLDTPLARYRQHRQSMLHKSRSAGTGIEAEMNLLIDLYNYLFSQFPNDADSIALRLRRSIRRIFLRARSHGYTRRQLRELTLRFTELFPSASRSAKCANLSASLLPLPVAYILRTLRRKVVGV